MCLEDQQAPLQSGCDTDTDVVREAYPVPAIRVQNCGNLPISYSLPEFSAVRRAGGRSPAPPACTPRRAESLHGPDCSPSGWPRHLSPGAGKQEEMQGNFIISMKH